jgi:hypothetical protein
MTMAVHATASVTLREVEDAIRNRGHGRIHVIGFRQMFGHVPQQNRQRLT